jgi:hypothetical protein
MFIRAVLLLAVGLALMGLADAPGLVHTGGATSTPSLPSTIYNYDRLASEAPTRAADELASGSAGAQPETRYQTSGRMSANLGASVVAAEEVGSGLPPLRQAYVDDVASISDNVAAWEKAGADPEFIAREAWADRRALGIQYKGLTPPDMLEQISARNIARYGDPLGPSIDWLRAQGKTWQQIIESATRSGGRDLGF